MKPKKDPDEWSYPVEIDDWRENKEKQIILEEFDDE
jgi:hypothetical protein